MNFASFLTKSVKDLDIVNGLAAPWGTQTRIAVVPASYIIGKEMHMKIRTGLIIATMRVLPKVVRCFRCHEIGHMLNKGTISPGKERCRKSGVIRDHTIANCNNVTTMCSKGSETQTKHVMASLACPTYRKLIRKGTLKGQAP